MLRQLDTQFRRRMPRSPLPWVALLAVTSPVAVAQGAIVPAPHAPAAEASSVFEVPAWLFPIPPPPAAPGASAASETLHVPGSNETYTRAQLTDLFAVPDWFPGAHPPMPSIVAHGRPPELYACAYCHLANGVGRPENATVAGLPAAYIEAQLASFRSGRRACAWTRTAYRPTALMTQVARAATDAEIVEAASYFASLRLDKPRAEVVEAEPVPKTRPAAWLYETTGDGDEPLGMRIIEVPRDFARHELRDPHAEYVAYVPPGSIERGRKLALEGTAGTPACASCHGADLRGAGLVPPIAGRSPTYLLRQLVAFRTGARNAPAGAPMQPVVAGLTLDDMIAVAAYAATQQP
ncbi:MAG: c-type cytochrome [Steroidobacteraceae bacterium]